MELKRVYLRDDRYHTVIPEYAVISQKQIAQVLVSALCNDATKNTTFELVAKRGAAQQERTMLFVNQQTDNAQKMLGF